MTVVVLPGDGIGREVAQPAVALLERLGVEVEEHPIGGAAASLWPLCRRNRSGSEKRGTGGDCSSVIGRF